MDILSAIKEDHDELRDQLANLIETATSNPKESARIFRSIYDHLVAHHETEEHVLFEKLKEFDAAKSIVEEAWEEHEAIDLYLERIKRSHKTERWGAKVSVLNELVEHHLAEEESELFKAVRENMGEQLEDLGEKFEAGEKRRLSK